jgi:large subunit ribosomal protein L17
MRHNKKFNHLSRKSAHRDAMLANMAISLIMHKRIVTTVAKAKALKMFVEPLITKAKDDTTHSRRVVFSYLQGGSHSTMRTKKEIERVGFGNVHKEAVNELFSTIAAKVADRPGGYTRILKLGNRLGDNAKTCFIELVDFNDAMLAAKDQEKTAAKKSTRRSRKKAAAPAAAAPAEEAPKTEE